MRKRTTIVSLSAIGAMLMSAACSAENGADKEVQTEAAEFTSSDGTIVEADGSETIGLAFTYFWYAVHETPEDCPDGYAMALRDVAIMNLPEAKQEYLLQPENRSTYYKMGYALSAKRMIEHNGTPICNIPDAYDDPPHRTVQSTVSFGRDLDGQDSQGDDPASCGRSDFVSPTGEGGIDNELYRVLGCIDSFRRDAEFAGGAMEDYHIGAYRDGEVTTLMEIRGVDDRTNDESVEVGIYSSQDPTPYNSEKDGVPFGSMTVTDNTLWHNKVQGRIVDGELITEPFDLRLKFGWTGRPAEYVIKGARVHLTLNGDGTASGDLAGYFDTRYAYWHNFHNEQGALEVANGFTCPAVHDALQKYSDGYPDPETGKCTAISTAMNIKAVPAFVIHPQADQLKRYFLDTREYYGVSMDEIAVADAEPMALVGVGGPPAAASVRKVKEKNDQE